jgi:hypothetical protein
MGLTNIDAAKQAKEERIVARDIDRAVRRDCDAAISTRIQCGDGQNEQRYQ